MRCLNCGARNPEGAAWCSQCLASLGEQAEDEAPPSGPTDPPRDASDSKDAASDAEVPLSPAGDLQAGGGRFRRHEGQIEWRCEVCQEWNLVGLARCTVCGTSMAGPEPTPTKDAKASRPVVLFLTVLLPGAGHAALGQMATAWARGLTFLLWFVGGASLVISALSSGEAWLPGVILLLGAAALWTITLLDVLSLLAGRTRQLLDARLFLWLVVGVIGLLMLTFMATFSRVGGGAG